MVASLSTMRIAGNAQRSLPKRVPFTVAVLQVAACPSGKDRVWLYDSRQPGLALMVTDAGSKTFYVYRKVQGRPQRVRLGGFPDISIDNARTLTKKTIGEIANGQNPMAVRREARAKGTTVGELWEWFRDERAKPHKRSWKADESRYDTHLKSWSARRLVDIKSEDVESLHRRFAKKVSPTTANRVLALLSTMFNKGWKRHPNPCRGVEKFPEESRERFLSADELKRFFGALADELSADWRDFFKLCLFTGARRGNVLSMEWKEIDLAATTWTIPGSKFKNKKQMTVALTAPAMEILKGRKGNKSDYVFPSVRGNGHIVNPAKAWEQLCERAKLDSVRIHDLRRTMGSWQAAAGASTTIIGKSLGHRSQQATAVYARLDLDPVRKSVEAATAAMLAAGTMPVATGWGGNGK